MSIPHRPVQRPGRQGWYAVWYDMRAQRKRYRKLASELPIARLELRRLQEELTVCQASRYFVQMTLETYYHDHYRPDYLHNPVGDSWHGKQRLHIERYILPALGSRMLDDVSLYDAETWYRELIRAVPRKYANHIASTLKRMLCRAEGKHMGATAVRRLKLLPNPRRIPDTLTREEVARMVAALDGRQRMLIELWVQTGLRLSEMQWLQWQDIDLAAGKLYVRAKAGHNLKDWEDRHIDLTDAAIASLEPYARAARPVEWVYPTAKGERYRSLSAHVGELFARAGVRAGSAVLLRHTFASLMLSSGCNLAELQRYMGHSTITTTERHYAAFVPGQRSSIHRADFGIGPRLVGVDWEESA